MLLEVEALSKNYRGFKAVDDVSFGVAEGEIVGLVGPNGAGKTTIIHMLLGLIAPSAGSIFLFNRRWESDREEILQRLNFASPYVGFPPRLTVRENLDVFAQLYGVPERKAKIAELLDRFGVWHMRNKPVARLSSGELTRVGLCKAFLNDPELLLLDEPTAHLDLPTAMQVREVLLETRQSEGASILYTSHNMNEVQRMCDRVIFLDRGRIVATGTPIEVTRAILKEEREAPALDEVFIRITRPSTNGSAQ